MNELRYNQNVMESAVEIAFTAGHYGFRTPNSRDMMSDFIAWAVEFESKPYDKDDWMELIESFAIMKLSVEVEQGRASCELGHSALPSIKKPLHYTMWQALKDADWVYLPENSDSILSKADFVKLCEGNDLHAYTLYGMCEWQHPATILDEAQGLEALFGKVERNMTALSVKLQCRAVREMCSPLKDGETVQSAS